MAQSSFENKTQQVKNHLIENGSITSWEAIKLFRATRLSAIIFKLRGSMNITSLKFKDKIGVNWVKYVLNK